MRAVITALFVNLVFYCTAQKENINWCFGDSCGVRFDSSITMFSSNIQAMEASASISDSTGNLLLYVGCPSLVSTTLNYQHYAWNSSNQLLQNGTMINGDNSTSQGLMILPRPDSIGQYYVFSIGVPSMINYPYSLYYSVADMNANGGLGAITIKNQLLETGITEKLYAVKHGNGRDWWLITHQDSTDVFIEYLISPAGISAGIQQSIGSAFNNCCAFNAGQLTSNLTGSRLVHVTIDGMIELFDFDRCNGALSNSIPLGDTTGVAMLNGYYGCQFSPNSKYLYVSQYGDSLFQFDLFSTNIKQSKTLVAILPDTEAYFTQMLVAPDNKIYISNNDLGNNLPYNSTVNKTLSIIRFPDSAAAYCGFIPYALYLGGHRTTLTLPNMPNYNLGPLTGSACDTLTTVAEVQDKQRIKIYPNPAHTDITFQFENFLDNNYEICLKDILGRSVLLQNGKTNATLLNIKNLTRGVYFIEIKNNGKIIYNGKQVVQ